MDQFETSIREAFISYGSNEITSPILNQEELIVTPLLNKIWDVYGSYSDVQLSRLATEIDGPWYIARNTHSERKEINIDEEVMKKHFKSKIQ